MTAPAPSIRVRVFPDERKPSCLPARAAHGARLFADSACRQVNVDLRASRKRQRLVRSPRPHAFDLHIFVRRMRRERSLCQIGLTMQAAYDFTGHHRPAQDVDRGFFLAFRGRQADGADEYQHLKYFWSPVQAATFAAASRRGGQGLPPMPHGPAGLPTRSRPHAIKILAANGRYARRHAPHSALAGSPDGVSPSPGALGLDASVLPTWQAWLGLIWMRAVMPL